MNICTIFLHIKNEKKQNTSIAKIFKDAFQTGQGVSVDEAASLEFDRQGEIFKNVCIKNDLLIAKKIKNTIYFVFGEDPVQATDCLDIDVSFVTKAKDLTKTISDIFASIKNFLSDTSVEVSFRQKQIKIYKVENDDIDKNGISVTATFENNDTGTRYENAEFNVTRGLFILGIIVSIFIYFKAESLFATVLSVVITIFLSVVSGYVKRKWFYDSVKITDFSNIFNTDSVQNISGSTGSTPQATSETFNAPAC